MRIVLVRKTYTAEQVAQLLSDVAVITDSNIEICGEDEVCCGQ